MSNNSFNISRLFLLIKRQGVLNFYPLMIGIAGVFGILLLISLLVAQYNARGIGNLFGLYMTVFFIAGYIFTSRVFSELNSPRQGYSFLMLPASTLEKLVGSWLLSGPIYVIVFLFFIQLIYFVTALFSDISVPFTGFFDGVLLKLIWIYLVTQSIFFLGACTFKSYNLLKTLFSLFLIVAFIGAFAGLLVWILFGGQIQGDEFGDDFKADGEFFFTEVIPFIFFYILAPFFLVVSYFKLKEREV